MSQKNGSGFRPLQALSCFRAAGLSPHRTLLIVVHSTADPVFSSNDTVRWYEELTNADGSASDYTRVFLVLGMNHCSGGPSADRFDILPLLEEWVEDDVAPEQVVASVDPLNPDVAARGWPLERTRLLCAYPASAVLSPSATDTESADAFLCE